MKILYLTNIPSPYRVEFFNELNKYCELTVVYDKNTEKDRNCKWYNDNEFKFKSVILGKFKFWSLNKILKEDYDIIIIGVYTTVSAIMSKFILNLKRKEYVINADGGFIKNEGKIKEFIKKYFIQSANYWLSSGLETNKYLINYGANEENIYIYPFSSIWKRDILTKNITRAEKLKIRKKYGYGNEKIFISVGNFIDRKGYDLLLNCISENHYHGQKFLLIGGGDKKYEYEKFLDDNNIDNVELIDFKSKKEILEYLKMSDIFIMPTREDIWGLVINEAMSCGLPIISSSSCLASLELNVNDLYVFDNLEDMNTLIKKYINLSVKELSTLGSSNLKIINKYTIENMSCETYKICDRILKKGSGKYDE